MAKKKPRNRPVLTEEQKAMAADMTAKYKATGETQEKLAERMGISQGLFSHWMTGREPVPADQAEKLAAIIKSTPEACSIAYRDSNNLKGDILALRFAVLGLATVLSGKRPDEGAAFDSRIREIATEFPHFLEGNGWLGMLLGQIKAAQNTAEADAAAARLPRVSSSSKRKR